MSISSTLAIVYYREFKFSTLASASWIEF